MAAIVPVTRGAMIATRVCARPATCRSGAAGLKAALTLARRGFVVAAAEKSGDFSGRVLWETWLRGLRQWFRVADYRPGPLRQMANVSVYPHSEMTVDDVLAFGADHAVIAAGAGWTTNLFSSSELPTEVSKGKRIYTPDDLAAGTVTEGPVAVLDFDNHYLGSASAEELAQRDLQTTFFTTAGAAKA